MSFTCKRDHKISVLLALLVICIYGTMIVFAILFLGPLIELRLYYDKETAYDILTTQTKEESEYYKIANILDLSFTTLMGIFVIHFIVKILKYNICWCILTIIVMGLDYIESVSILIYLWFNNNIDFVIKLGYITLFKWLLFFIDLILISSLIIHKYFNTSTQTSGYHINERQLSPKTTKLNKMATMNEMIVY